MDVTFQIVHETTEVKPCQDHHSDLLGHFQSVYSFGRSEKYVSLIFFLQKKVTPAKTDKGNKQNKQTWRHFKDCDTDMADNSSFSTYPKIRKNKNLIIFWLQF